MQNSGKRSNFMVSLPKKYILVQRRKEVSGSMEKAPKKYPSLKEVAPVTL